jgi:hypothetical protein
MSTALAPILQYFFTEHLDSHKQVSPRTIVAYRDSFRLMLQFLKKKTGKQPFTLCVDDLDAPAIIDFLGKSRGAARQPSLFSECSPDCDSILFPRCRFARSRKHRRCRSRACHSKKTNRPTKRPEPEPARIRSPQLRRSSVRKNPIYFCSQPRLGPTGEGRAIPRPGKPLPGGDIRTG